MNAQELQELKAAALAASAGPWGTAQTYADNGAYTGLDVYAADGAPLIAEEQHPGDSDARFIAAANPAAILELIAIAERQASSAVLSDEQKSKIMNDAFDSANTWAEALGRDVAADEIYAKTFDNMLAALSAAAEQPAQVVVHAKPYGWLTGESTSHRQGAIQDLTTNYEWAKKICDENNKLNREYDPEHEDVAPVPLYAAAQAPAQVAPQAEAVCTCPSGDGSLCWPCPTHPPVAQGAVPKALTHDQIREAGGIVHKDGNIFFTNLDKLNNALRLAQPEVVTDGPAGWRAAINNMATAAPAQADIRNAALEDAAQIAERTYVSDAFRFELGKEAARAIRSLKSQSSSGAAEAGKEAS